VAIRSGFGPLMEGFTHLPFNDIDALRAAVSEDSVALLVEPVQGEGGIQHRRVSPCGILQQLLRRAISPLSIVVPAMDIRTKKG